MRTEDAFGYALSSNQAWAGYKSHQNPDYFSKLASGQSPTIRKWFFYCFIFVSLVFPWRGPTSSPSIKLQILLRSEWRTPQGVAKVQEILRSMGLMPTAGGAATISAELELNRFEEVFGVIATETAPQPPSKTEAGKSGGYNSPDLKVPAALADFVQSISATPGHYYLLK